MNRQVIFLTLFLLLFTIAAKAQSTYDYPWRGATHTYTASVTDAGNDNPVRWYITTDQAGTEKADTTDVFRFVTSGYSEPDSTLSGTAVYSVQVYWKNTVSQGAKYYLYLEVDDETSGCTNTMAMEIQIAADFNALAWDVTGSANPGTVDPDGVGEDVDEETCPDDVVDPLWDGDSHTNIGNSQIIYRVDREFSVLAWQFEYELSEDASQTFTLDSIKFVDAGGTELTPVGASDLTGVVSVESDEDYVLVYAYIANQMDKTLDFTFELLTADDKTKDASDNLDSTSSDNSDTHRIKPMPAITNFSGS